MGIFDLFGNRKAQVESEEEREKALALQKEKGREEARKAHEDLDWPGILPINPVNIQGAEGSVMEDTLSPERKDQVGVLIYEEDISQESLSELESQELLFLLTALEVFQKKAPLPNFEKNHRKVYNEVLSRVRDAEYLYVLYDQTTRYPFIDHGCGNVYFEEETANKAAEIFGKQFRKLAVKKCKLETGDDNTGKKNGFFDFLYYIGIENMVVDNGGYRARFKRSEIVAAPGEWNRDDKGRNPNNPMLNFAMLDFMEEMRWPVRYEKRDEILRAKEMRMLSLIRAGQFIVPMQYEGTVDKLEDGRMKLTPDTKIKLPVIKTKDEKQFIPVYTDGFEFAKNPGSKEWNAGVILYQDILRFISDKDGICLNPEGQSLVLTKDRMMAIEVAARQADMINKKNQAGRAAAQSADGAVQQAVSQAISKMKEENGQ